MTHDGLIGEHAVEVTWANTSCFEVHGTNEYMSQENIYEHLPVEHTLGRLGFPKCLSSLFQQEPKCKVTLSFISPFDAYRQGWYPLLV